MNGMDDWKRKKKKKSIQRNNKKKKKIVECMFSKEMKYILWWNSAYFADLTKIHLRFIIHYSIELIIVLRN